MTVGRSDAVRAVVSAAILGLLVFGVLVFYAPDSVAFSPNNYGWNGIESISFAYDINFTNSLSSVPMDSVLVITQPSLNFSAADVAAVRAHLEGGGAVLVADKSGLANSLLRGLGSGISIESKYSIDDPIYNWKAKNLPTALVLPGIGSRFPFASGVTGIALDQPSPLLLREPSDVSIAVTSPLSYTVEPPSSSLVAKGPFVVAAAVKVGNGTLLVVSDSQFLLNSEWTIADNRALIGNLFQNASAFIDASHWASSPLTSSTAQLKAELRQGYDAVSGSPARYLLTLSFVVVAVALVPDGDGGGIKMANTDRKLGTFNKEAGQLPKGDRYKNAE